MATRLSKSAAGSDGNVSPLPAALLAQAQKIDASITLDEYTLARVVASEFGSGPEAAQLAIADCDATRAKASGRSIFNHATGGGGIYGRQGYNGRPVSTSLDPTTSHLAIARAALGGRAGFARGATFYFDPRTQYSCWSQPMRCIPKGSSQPNRLQHPLAILESWSYHIDRGTCGRDEKNRYYCKYGKRGAPKSQWVGQIDGINPYDLMLFRPKADDNHAEMTAEAKRIIERGIAGTSSIHVSGGEGGGGLALAGLLGLGAWWWTKSAK